jgi:hypothetical protein
VAFETFQYARKFTLLSLPLSTAHLKFTSTLAQEAVEQPGHNNREGMTENFRACTKLAISRVLSFVTYTPETQGAGAIVAGRHQQELAVLIVPISLREIPD